MTDAPEQWQLAIPFVEMVERTIGVVLGPAGFAPSVAAPNDVRYDDRRVYLRVRHHPRDGEVAIDFGRVDREELFSFGLYLGLVAPEDEVARGTGVSWTAEEVDSNLRGFARVLREHGKLILEGDAGTFQRMETLRWWDVWPNTDQGQDPARAPTDHPIGHELPRLSDREGQLIESGRLSQLPPPSDRGTGKP